MFVDQWKLMESYFCHGIEKYHFLAQKFVSFASQLSVSNQQF